MKVFYHGQSGWDSKPTGLASELNLLALTGNNWDDYGTKTTLDACLYFGGERFEFDFHIKVLIEGCEYTASLLNELKSSGWDGFFPIPSVNYISLPSDIEFYSIIVSKIGDEGARDLMASLCDAGFLKRVEKDESISDMLQSPEFAHSLLRESGAFKAYEDGWRIFDGSSNEVYDFDLNILSREMQSIPVPFKFRSNLLPYDINVLIGPNGIGKSYAIKSLTEYWLKTESGEPEFLDSIGHVPFSSYPNFSKFILVSYSPFEDFKINLKDVELQDKQTYKYFGFRKLDENGDELVDRYLPSKNSAQSIVNAMYDDEKFGFIKGRVNKLNVTYKTLKHAFEFDFDSIALEVVQPELLGVFELSIKKIDERLYLPINSVIAKHVSIDDLLNACNLDGGVAFLNNNCLCSLSSGQKMFSYIVINVVGELRENSLVVIDEPELFLHPTLEIKLISLLKAVLAPFNSKAILATHSLSVVREVPSSCVHIFRDVGLGLDVIRPPFETFGGDMQRISTYVFGEDSVPKPFDKWIENLVIERGADYLISHLGNELNEEMTMKILRLGHKYGR